MYIHNLTYAHCNVVYIQRTLSSYIFNIHIYSASIYIYSVSISSIFNIYIFDSICNIVYIQWIYIRLYINIVYIQYTYILPLYAYSLYSRFIFLDSICNMVYIQWIYNRLCMHTGRRRPIGCLKLQVVFRKKATNCRALLRKMTNEDKASYGSSPPYIV